MMQPSGPAEAVLSQMVMTAESLRVQGLPWAETFVALSDENPARCASLMPHPAAGSPLAETLRRAVAVKFVSRADPVEVVHSEMVMTPSVVAGMPVEIPTIRVRYARRDQTVAMVGEIIPDDAPILPTTFVWLRDRGMVADLLVDVANDRPLLGVAYPSQDRLEALHIQTSVQSMKELIGYDEGTVGRGEEGGDR